MKILLIGAGGQIGGELAPRLRAIGDVDAPRRAELDLEDAAAIAAYVDRMRPDVAVNAAAYTDVDGAESDAAAGAINAEAPGALARALARHGAALIHFSTDYVFDGEKTGAYQESDATGPLNVYGRTKLEGERGIADSGVANLVLRTSWIYSAVRRNFLLTMLELAQRNRTLSVVDDQKGAPTPAWAVAEATASILGKIKAGPPDYLRSNGGLYHLACRGATTWHGFACEIFDTARAMGVVLTVENVARVSSDEFPRPARRPRNSVLDSRRIAGAFGIELPEWRDALHRTMEQALPSLDPDGGRQRGRHNSR